MNIQTIVTRVRGHLDRQRRFRAAVAEINSLSNSDLADMRGNRQQMLYAAHREIFG